MSFDTELKDKIIFDHFNHIYHYTLPLFYRLGCVVELWKLFLALMLGTSLENVHRINGGQESTFFEKIRCD